jgi:glycosyltransferase involved in cell wall biosynthesis
MNMPGKKRVLVICGGTKVFGAEIVTLSILNELKQNGYKLFCLTSGWNDGHFHKRLEELGISYMPVKLGFIYITKLLWTLDTLIHLPGALSEIAGKIKKFKPDLIYHTSYTTLIMAYPVLKGNKNLLFVFDPYYGKRNKMYFKFFDKLIHTYVAVSNAIKLNLIAIGASAQKIIILKNGINVSQPPAPQELKNIIRFGIIGQIAPRKGHDDVIEALRILKSEHIAFKCAIIGSGDENYIHSLKEKIKQSNLEGEVLWIDFIKDRDEIYRLLDVVLVPSTTLDPLPTVAMEAGLYYKPCIVTNMGGLPEIVINETTGFIVNAHAPSVLAQKMKLLIANRDMIKEMGTAAHDHIVKNFDVKIQIRSLYPIIDN